jgi:hypothetical protein
MITSEQELRHAYESVTKMYALRDRLAADTSGDTQTREDEVAGVDSMIRKVERQIAAYLAANRERTREQTTTAA